MTANPIAVAIREAVRLLRESGRHFKSRQVAEARRLLEQALIEMELHQMSKKLLGVKIPEHLRFADLQLARDPITRAVSFNWDPIEAICRASDIDIAIMRDGPEDNVSCLIVVWYAFHRETGGDQDPIQEQLLREVRREDASPYN
jgi:hypothetical protein